MVAVFISGTDTEVGKTVVSGLLARYVLEQGLKVITQKWVQTGVPGEGSSDIDVHLKLMGRKKAEFTSYLPSMLPYKFSLAASPHLAALDAGKPIKEKKIKKSFEILSKDFEFVICEGSGGLLVPFNSKKLLVDIAADLRLPVIVVVQNKLGAINHTLLTLEALQKRKMKIVGVVFNAASTRNADVVTDDNPKIIKTISGVNVLGSLPWAKNNKLLYENFMPIGKKILKSLEL